MSFKHRNINFTVEHENIGLLSFLDVKVCRNIRSEIENLTWDYQ